MLQMLHLTWHRHKNPNDEKTYTSTVKSGYTAQLRIPSMLAL